MFLLFQNTTGGNSLISLVELLEKYGFSFMLNIILAYSVLKLYRQSRQDRDGYFEKSSKDKEAYQTYVASMWEKRLEEMKIVQKIIEDQSRSNDELAKSIENILSLIKQDKP